MGTPTNPKKVMPVGSFILVDKARSIVCDCISACLPKPKAQSLLSCQTQEGANCPTKMGAVTKLAAPKGPSGSCWFNQTWLLVVVLGSVIAFLMVAFTVLVPIGLVGFGAFKLWRWIRPKAQTPVESQSPASSEEPAS